MVSLLGSLPAFLNQVQVRSWVFLGPKAARAVAGSLDLGPALGPSL